MTCAAATLPCVLAAGSEEEEEEEEDAEMTEELLWEGLFLGKFFCAARGGLQNCVAELETGPTSALLPEISCSASTSVGAVPSQVSFPF